MKIKGMLALLGLLVIFHVPASMAKLKEIGDEELSSISGQAYISIDQLTHPEQDNLSYTRVNLGMKIETLITAETFELGNYHRWQNHPTNPELNGQPCYTCSGNEEGLEASSADLYADNFSLGYIQSDAYTEKYKSVPRVVKGYDRYGRIINYQDGEIVPFEINDPFFEFAVDDNTHKVVGLRIGFGDTKGILSGNILSLSGAVDVDIRDGVAGLESARQKQDGTLIEEALTLLTPLLVANGELSAQASLVDENGDPDAIRSGYIGMENGSEFKIENADTVAANAVPLLSDIGLIGSNSRSEFVGWTWDCGLMSFLGCYNIYIESDDCVMLGIPTCFPLTNFQSMPVGKVKEINGKQYITDTASGLFLSFQTQDLDWGTGAANNPMAEMVRASSGAFLNLPTGAVKVNLSEVYNGIHGVRREYIDRGVGLF